MSDGNEILDDHRWQRTKLIPPMMDITGSNLALIKWKHELVPELIWISEILESSDVHQAIDVVTELSESGQQLFGEGEYLFAKDYESLTESQIEQFRKSIDNEILSDLSESLSLLLRVYPDYPLGRLLNANIETEHDSNDLEHIGRRIDELSVKTSPLATKTLGIWIGVSVLTGKTVIPLDSDFGDINDVFDYPETDESRKVAASIRASVNAFHGVSTDDSSPRQSETATKFWGRGFEISECIFPFEVEETESEEGIEALDDAFFEEMVGIGFGFEESLKESIIELWYEAPHDPQFTGKTEVLDGLLMRQVSLATNTATSPSLWTADTAGMILRCMTENQITLEWFNQEGSIDDYKNFIEYGLGQKKLILEHLQRVSDMVDSDDSERIKQGHNMMEQKLDAQRYKYLIPVDVGHWADKNTRDLATEANCKDLYDLRFQQHNPAIHGSWDFLYQNYLVECQNPLHQGHRIPQFRPLPKIPFVVIEVGNLMNRSMDSWIEARGLDNEEYELVDLAESVRSYLKDSGKFENAPGMG